MAQHHSEPLLPGDGLCHLRCGAFFPPSIPAPTASLGGRPHAPSPPLAPEAHLAGLAETDHVGLLGRASNSVSAAVFPGEAGSASAPMKGEWRHFPRGGPAYSPFFPTQPAALARGPHISRRQVHHAPLPMRLHAASCHSVIHIHAEKAAGGRMRPLPPDQRGASAKCVCARVRTRPTQQARQDKGH